MIKESRKWKIGDRVNTLKGIQLGTVTRIINPHMIEVTWDKLGKGFVHPDDIKPSLQERTQLVSKETLAKAKRYGVTPEEVEAYEKLPSEARRRMEQAIGKVILSEEANRFVWIGVGVEYQKFSSPSQAGDELGKAISREIVSPGQYLGFVKLGVTIGPYQGNRYIKLFWGDADSKYPGELSAGDKMEFREAFDKHLPSFIRP